MQDDRRPWRLGGRLGRRLGVDRLAALKIVPRPQIPRSALLLDIKRRGRALHQNMSYGEIFTRNTLRGECR